MDVLFKGELLLLALETIIKVVIVKINLSFLLAHAHTTEAFLSCPPEWAEYWFMWRGNTEERRQPVVSRMESTGGAYGGAKASGEMFVDPLAFLKKPSVVFRIGALVSGDQWSWCSVSAECNKWSDDTFISLMTTVCLMNEFCISCFRWCQCWCLLWSVMKVGSPTEKQAKSIVSSMIQVNTDNICNHQKHSNI